MTPTVNIPAGTLCHCDRDGCSDRPGGPQGFDIGIAGMKIHFEDETNAIAMARQILYRMGLEDIARDKYRTRFSHNGEDWAPCNTAPMGGTPSPHTGRLDDEIAMAKVHVDNGYYAQVQNSIGEVVWDGKPKGSQGQP